MNNYNVFIVNPEINDDGYVELYRTEERAEAIRMGRQLAKSFKDRISIERESEDGDVAIELEIDQRGYIIK